MVHSGSSKCFPGDRGLFHTGMFLRPHIASALQKIIQNKMVRERTQFTVAKSQIHPDGNCEMVVRRLDPSVSTGAIMDVLKKCRDLVKECSLSENVSALDRTIDLSDDDSVCVLSPARFNQRSVKFMGPGSSLSSIVVEKTVEPESLSTRTNCKQPVGSSKDDRSRMVTLKRNASEDTSAVTSNPLSKRPNFTVIVSNDLKAPVMSSTPVSNDSDTLLPFSEDVLPSAPAWTCDKPAEFPISNITKLFGVKEKFDSNFTKSSNSLPRVIPAAVPACGVSDKQEGSATQGNDSWINAQHSKFPLSNISRILGVKDAVDGGVQPSCSSKADKVEVNNTEINGGKEHPKSQFSQDLGKVDRTHELSKPSLSDISIEILGEAPSRHVGVTSREEQPRPTRGENDMGVLDRKQSSDPTSSILTSSGVCTLSKSTPPVENGKSANGRSSKHADDESSEDEIIIEKEVKVCPKTPSLIIDDSDDDIAICEVLNGKKKGKKKRKKAGIISAGTTFVASTSDRPAPDFIPLFSTYRRIDPITPNMVHQTSNTPAPSYIPLGSQRSGPKTFNCPRNAQKMAKLQKLKMKGQQALRAHERSQSNAPKASQGSSKDDPHKKKQDYDGNVMNPNSGEPKSGLRPIIIDGCNVAIGHGKGHFSVPGLKICIKYFTDRGHKVHTFVPKFKRFHVTPEDRKVLDDLEKGGSLSFTPSRTMQDGRKVASYDDRFIVQTAAELGGIIVSTDNYRDLLAENESWRETIEQRLLMFTWVGDMLLFPNDPLGRNGPHLQDFLRFPDAPAK